VRGEASHRVLHLRCIAPAYPTLMCAPADDRHIGRCLPVNGQLFTWNSCPFILFNELLNPFAKSADRALPLPTSHSTIPDSVPFLATSASVTRPSRFHRQAETMTAIPPTFTFSQSSLQAFEDCPRRFWLAYIEQLPWPAVEASPVQEHEALMRQGEHFHRLVQRTEIGITHTKSAQRSNRRSPLGLPPIAAHRPADLPTRFVEIERVLSIGVRGETAERRRRKETRRQGDNAARQSLNRSIPQSPISNLLPNPSSCRQVRPDRSGAGRARRDRGLEDGKGAAATPPHCASAGRQSSILTCWSKPAPGCRGVRCARNRWRCATGSPPRLLSRSSSAMTPPSTTPTIAG
jgi:hypothetical protein